jgi:hypothetical protein
VDLARANIELRTMKWTPNAASVHDFSASERREGVRTVRLRGVKAVL